MFRIRRVSPDLGVRGAGLARHRLDIRDGGQRNSCNKENPRDTTRHIGRDYVGVFLANLGRAGAACGEWSKHSQPESVQKAFVSPSSGVAIRTNPTENIKQLDPGLRKGGKARQLARAERGGQELLHAATRRFGVTYFPETNQEALWFLIVNDSIMTSSKTREE